MTALSSRRSCSRAMPPVDHTVPLRPGCERRTDSTRAGTPPTRSVSRRTCSRGDALDGHAACCDRPRTPVDPLHGAGEHIVGRIDDEVVVGAHQTNGEACPVGVECHPFDLANHAQAIRTVSEQEIRRRRSRHEVIEARRRRSRIPAHVSRLPTFSGARQCPFVRFPEAATCTRAIRATVGAKCRTPGRPKVSDTSESRGVGHF